MMQKSVYLFQTLIVYPIYQENFVNKGYHSGKKVTEICMKH